MTQYEHIELGKRTKILVSQLFEENPKLHTLIQNADSYPSFFETLSNYTQEKLSSNQIVRDYLRQENKVTFDQLNWSDVALIRLKDYIDHHELKLQDQNLYGEVITSEPFKWLWDVANDEPCSANDDFFYDLIHLFRQLNGDSQKYKPSTEQVMDWIAQYSTGLDKEMIEIRQANKNRIITVLIKKIEEGVFHDRKFSFDEGLSFSEKFEQMTQWWEDRMFHIKFAIRNPMILQELMDGSISEDDMQRLNEAYEKGIPFFINPYYLSLLIPFPTPQQRYYDRSIRDYIFYSQQLIDSFGRISAWEKEDIVKPGEPNAAGWILPSQHNIHRRYPEVAIFIPDTVGRSCGGLCVSCQRMYDFQSGHLNFNMEKLKPKESWPERLKMLVKHYEQDAQLRDILITGGDAFMSANRTIKQILDEVYHMALRKKEANKARPEGKKHAEILRVRLGTRLPVYIPQRVTEELTSILTEFKQKASAIGIRQFVVQTHFVSPMEITPEAKQAIERLQGAGWMVTNQQVFTAAASRRGYTANLRKTLNEIGVVTYYTFSVKGFMENSENFSTNARALQEMMEEKTLGIVEDTSLIGKLERIPDNPENIKNLLGEIKSDYQIPFVATDRSVMNLPGVGKSMTFRVIGITEDGRRILEFDHDYQRNHSPIIHDMGRVTIIESKSIRSYLRQLETMGEKREEYLSIYGYSLGLTEPRMPIYEYPEYDYQLTEEITNLEI